LANAPDNLSPLEHLVRHLSVASRNGHPLFDNRIHVSKHFDLR